MNILDSLDTLAMFTFQENFVQGIALNMMRLKVTGILFCLMGLGQTALAAPPAFPRDEAASLDLRDHVGKTFFQTFFLEGIGVDAEIDNSVKRPVVITGAAESLKLINTKFDPSVAERLARFYKNGTSGFMKVIGHFAGKSIVPANYYQNVRVHAQPLATNNDYVGRASGSSSTLSLLASGAGTLIIIDDENHFYNVAYNDPIVQSGRSFAASGSRKLLDATHRDYLKAVDAAIAPSKEATMEFYQVLLETLTNTDTSGVQELSKEGQIAFSDFLSVYSAELERHEMVGLNVSKAWEIDMTQVAFIASYTNLSQMAIKGTRFEQGDIEAYVRRKGSIGNTCLSATPIGQVG